MQFSFIKEKFKGTLARVAIEQVLMFYPFSVPKEEQSTYMLWNAQQ